MSEEIRKEAEETVAESEETPTEAAPEFDREVLESVAENLNKTLGLKPAIDLKQDDQDLFDAIKTESAEVGIDPKTSKVSDKVVKSDRKALAPETWTFLEENGMLDHLPKEEAPAPKKSKDKPAKEKTEKEPKEKKNNLPPRDFSNSSKAQVYRAYEKGETDVTKLSAVVSGAVKDGTIKSWMGQWKNGKNLPAIASK